MVLAMIAAALVSRGTAEARRRIEAFAAQSTRQLWTSAAINGVAMVLIYLHWHRAHVAYAVVIAICWFIPNLRSLDAALTHARQVIESPVSPFLAFFGARGTRASLIQNPALYTRWKTAVIGWALSASASLLYAGYDWGLRSAGDGVPAASDVAPAYAAPSIAGATPVPAVVPAPVTVSLPRGTVLRAGPGPQFRGTRSLRSTVVVVVLDDSVPGWIKVQDGETIAWARRPSERRPAGAGGGR